MDTIILESVSKVFRHRPAWFNWIGKERRGETWALDGVSLGVSQGQVLALLGPNGSGKTTLLKLISSVLLADAGRVLVGGKDTRKEAREVRRQVGFAVASERSFYPRLTARENLDFFAALDDVRRGMRAERVEAMLCEVALGDAADTLVMKFSSGMYQRLAIARALLKKPSVLLLDEPTRSLDPAAAEQFCGLIRCLARKGSAVVMATHSLEEAANVADAVAVLKKGRLAGYRKMVGVEAERLRAFYFQTTGEVDVNAGFALRSA